ncbi:MAG: hypothetical protein M5U26_19620 [Planctomycetota bacterium]|nr:hypothetical protein [Planctomycetota bacterium]
MKNDDEDVLEPGEPDEISIDAEESEPTARPPEESKSSTLPETIPAADPVMIGAAIPTVMIPTTTMIDSIITMIEEIRTPEQLPERDAAKWGVVCRRAREELEAEVEQRRRSGFVRPNIRKGKSRTPEEQRLAEVKDKAQVESKAVAIYNELDPVYALRLEDLRKAQDERIANLEVALTPLRPWFRSHVDLQLHPFLTNQAALVRDAKQFAPEDCRQLVKQEAEKVLLDLRRARAILTMIPNELEPQVPATSPTDSGTIPRMDACKKYGVSLSTAQRWTEVKAGKDSDTGYCLVDEAKFRERVRQRDARNAARKKS